MTTNQYGDVVRDATRDAHCDADKRTRRAGALWAEKVRVFNRDGMPTLELDREYQLPGFNDEAARLRNWDAQA